MLAQIRFGKDGPRNNGDFQATWHYLGPRGWKSKDTIANALAELLEVGFVIRTRQGGRHKCSLYAVSWLPINECNAKLDAGMGPTDNAPIDWRNRRKRNELPRQPGQSCPDNRDSKERECAN